MTDQSEASERIIVRSETEITGRDGAQATVRQVYQPPLDGRSDDYAGFDMQVARGIGELLNRHYFGYAWKSFADTRQGIVAFSIPELMGETLHYVINLKQFGDLQPQLIIEKAGELLERMRLPRGQADMALVLEAKANRQKFHFEDVKQ